MTDRLIVEGLRPYDGAYDLDVQQGFTIREWGWIKRLAGYHPLTLEDAFRNLDPEFWTVYAVIVLRRAGKLDARDLPDLYERLLDQEFERVIRLEFDTTVAEGGDQVDDPTASSNGKAGSSGPSSTPSSESLDSHPKATGTPGSVISGSVPLRSGS